MSKTFKVRSTCRLCLSDRIEKIFDMPVLPPVDKYRLSHEPDVLERFEMSPYQCHDCGHVQLRTVVDPSLLFEEYSYVSSLSRDLSSHFQRAAEMVSQIACSEGVEKSVLDIGSNDGLFLVFLKQNGFKVLGVDPASAPVCAARARGIDTELAFFSLRTAEQILERHGKFGFITANNVFSHSDQIDDIVNGVRKLLCPNGYFICEVSYLLDTVRNNVLDYIYHEHLDYHSLIPLTRFFARHKMQLVKVERIDTKGGSIRCYVKLGIQESLNADMLPFLERERRSRVHDIGTLRAWKLAHESVCQDIRSEVLDLNAQGLPVIVFGANATSVVLLALLNLENLVTHVVDDFEGRWGLRSPISGAPVSSPSLLSELPEWVCIIGAWRFSDQILSRYSDLKSTRRVFVTPQFGTYELL